MKKIILITLLLILTYRFCALAQRKNTAYYYNKGLEFYSQKQPNEALYCFDKAAKKQLFAKKKDSLLYFNAAVLATELKEYQTALKFYSKCEKIDFKKQTTLLETANIHKEMGSNDLFLKTLTKGIDKYPDSCMPFIIPLINHYIENNEQDLAIAYLKKAVRQNPENASYLEAIGAMYYSKKEADTALIYYNKALTITPENENLHYNIGVVYYNKAAIIIGETIYISLNNMPEYNAKMELSKEYFRYAQTYFENCYRLNNNEKSLRTAMETIYSELNNQEKLQAIKISREALLQLIGRDLVMEDVKIAIKNTNTAPIIIMQSPAIEYGAKKIVKQPTIKLDGTATDKQGISHLSINGKSIVYKKDGSFSHTVELHKGNNIIEIEAMNKAEQSSEYTFTIYYLSE